MRVRRANAQEPEPTHHCSSENPKWNRGTELKKRAHQNGVTDPLLQAFTITEQEKADIIAFLESLTDEEFITDPRFADPWVSE